MKISNRYTNIKDSGLGDIIFNALNMSPTTPVLLMMVLMQLVIQLHKKSKTQWLKYLTLMVRVTQILLTGKFELQYDLLKDLKITSRLGYTYVNIASKGFNPYQFYGVGHND